MKPNEDPDEFGVHPLDKFIANEKKEKISMNTAILDGFQVHPIDLFVTQNNTDNNITNHKIIKQKTYQNYPQSIANTQVNILPNEITNINYVNPQIHSFNETNKTFSSNSIHFTPNNLNLNMNVIANNNDTFYIINNMRSVPKNKVLQYSEPSYKIDPNPQDYKTKLNIINVKPYLNNAYIGPVPQKTLISKCNNILKGNKNISYNQRPFNLNYAGEIYSRKKTYMANLDPEKRALTPLPKRSNINKFHKYKGINGNLIISNFKYKKSIYKPQDFNI